MSRMKESEMYPNTKVWISFAIEAQRSRTCAQTLSKNIGMIMIVTYLDMSWMWSNINRSILKKRKWRKSKNWAVSILKISVSLQCEHLAFNLRNSFFETIFANYEAVNVKLTGAGDISAWYEAHWTCYKRKVTFKNF